MKRSLRLVLALTLSAASGVLAMTAAPASAQTREIRMKFIAYNADLSQYLIKLEDSAQGAAFQIRETETAKIKKVQAIADKADEVAKLKVLKKTFKVEAIIDQQDPKGRVSLFGSQEKKGKGFNLMALMGARVGVVGPIPLTTEENAKKPTKASVKEVVWSPDGGQVHVIVTQKIPRPDGIEEVDGIHFFKFKIWKVKWLQPEPEPPPTEEGGQ